MDKFFRCSIVVIPHLDDEVFCAGSLLLNYPNKVLVFVTHPTDTVSESAFRKQIKMSEDACSRINKYRVSKGYPKLRYTITEGAGPKGLPDTSYMDVLHSIEKEINNVALVDNYVFTLKSTHQSHNECNAIAGSLLRSPFLEKMTNILETPYPQTYFAPSIWSSDDKDYNAYLRLDEEQMDILYKCISIDYGVKNPPTSILSADAFKAALKYYGYAIGAPYAQPYVIKRSKLVM